MLYMKEDLCLYDRSINGCFSATVSTLLLLYHNWFSNCLFISLHNTMNWISVSLFHFQQLLILSCLQQIQQQVTSLSSSANTTTVVTQQAPISSATPQPTQIQTSPLATTTLQGLAGALQGTQQIVFLNPTQLTTGLQPLLIQNQVRAGLFNSSIHNFKWLFCWKISAYSCSLSRVFMPSVI